MQFHKMFLLMATVVQTATTAFAQVRTNNDGESPNAIICLTYDDALPSQIKTVIPQLNAFNFKGTFFINSIRGSADALGHGAPSLISWKAAAAQGHELANHTLFHPCPEKLGWEKELALETYTSDKLLSEIKAMHTYLDAMTTQKEKRPFAYPCNETTIAGLDYTIRLRELGIVSYARVGGNEHSIITDFKNVDEFKIPSWHVMEGTSSEDMIAFVDKTIRLNGVGIFQFHDVDGSLFSISGNAHQKLLNYLQANAHRVRVLTFSQAINEKKGHK